MAGFFHSAESETLIEPDVDLDADGKHYGYLRIPHSVHRSAYGWLPMPVVSIKNGNGPRVLLMAGTHGDEYEGQIALCRLARDVAADAITGQVIILPMANYPAARAGLRTSPIDGGNLNRLFPGDPHGSVTLKIAHLIETVLMRDVDLMIDLHSGGSSLLYLPSILVKLQPDGTLDPRERALVDAYGAPWVQVQRPASVATDNRQHGAARRNCALFLCAEFAGAGTVSREALDICERGLPRALHAMGVLASLPAGLGEPDQSRYLEVIPRQHFLYATDDGLYEPLVELGDEVKGGEPAAAIHFPETPWREPVIETFKADGLAVCKRMPGRVLRGDCLFHLASDWNPDPV